MHLEAVSGAERACDTCGSLFTPRKPWQRFCKTYGNKCHTAFHGAEARLTAIKEAAPGLYLTLSLIADGPDPVAAELASAAIKDLKPPESPKALLEKAKA